MTRLIDCDTSQLTSILAILNEAIENSTALWDYKARTSTAMESWLSAKQQYGFPVIGLVSSSEELLGFASYGAFRAWPAYKYTVEHSVYVHVNHRGRGYGKVLLGAIIRRAQSEGYHTMIAGIESSNLASKSLHLEFGFEPCGIVRHAGFKFGRWLDLEFHQLIFDTPSDPMDDD